jgi:hypothetical protein
MDMNRMTQLAGIKRVKFSDAEFEQLNETVEIEDNVTVEQLQSRLDACKRALGIANSLPDPADRKKWVKAVFVNLNKVRSALQKMLNKME